VADAMVAVDAVADAAAARAGSSSLRRDSSRFAKAEIHRTAGRRVVVVS
jgi:hypothetical protein